MKTKRGAPYADRYEKRGEDECWPWLSYKDSGGYGMVKTHKAHRMMWEQTFGPIPPGMCVCHTCDNRECVNPKHLWLGTHADNMKDMREKNRAVGHPGEKNPSAILTERQAKYVFMTAGTHKSIAKQYGVSPALVGGIKQRKIWATATAGLIKGLTPGEVAASNHAAIARDPRSQNEIAKAFKISQGAVSTIKRRSGEFRGKGTYMVTLTPEQVEAIRAEPGVQQKIAAKYGTSQGTVSLIKLGKYRAKRR